MKAEKKIKKEIIEISKKNPEKFYPINALKNVLNFKRQKCKKCSTFFWSKNDRDFCGDSDCIGGYKFIGKNNVKEKLSFVEVYKKFSNFMKEKGYTPISRFPIVARWRDDLDFTIASIIGFQPHVVKGEIKPIANPLVIPQNCIRFGDIDNVGLTGRHHTSFTMIGQHAFMDKKEFNQEKYFLDWIEWYIEVFGIDSEEIVIHEDAWAGGGNCGASLEVFAGGLELGNQVYMKYDMSNAKSFDQVKELDLNVLDMGMGQERFAWYSQGSSNSYIANMPKVCKFLFEKTNLNEKSIVYEKFIPYSGSLNIDENDNIEETWNEISKILNVKKEDLKKEIKPLSQLYSIADHTRTLLYALSDGALPSNVKGGYNLRILLRRCFDFIEENKWDLDLYEILKIHAEELEPQYPELKEEINNIPLNSNIPSIKKLLEIEREKYFNHRNKIKSTIENLIKKGKNLSDNDLVNLYVSKGISPSDIEKEFNKKSIKINIPSNFYYLISEHFEKKESSDDKKNNELKELIKDYPPTKLEYYLDSKKFEGESNILGDVKFENKRYIILDRTIFYPTGGGQANDVGFIGDKEVINVIKVGNVVLHEIKE